MLFRICLLIVVAALLLAGCSLSSEPEIAAELSLPTAAPEIAAPVAPPDLALGAAFYAEHCAACHGTGGAGDGEMVRDGRLPSPPPDFHDPNVVHPDSPLDYLRFVTEGNMMAGMPPFARYSEQERWAAAAFVYTGWVTPDVLARGAEIYAAECASCHGEHGAGDGPDAPELMPSLTDLDAMSSRTDTDLYTVIHDGAAATMPAFGDRLSEDDLWAVVGRVRALAVQGVPGFPAAADAATEEAVQAPVATDEVNEAAAASAAVTGTPAPTAVAAADVAPPETITVTGRVTNGTGGGSIPGGASLTLHMFDPPDFAETNVQTTLAADGTYAFEEVPHQAERSYLISLEYGGVFFSSTVYNLADPSTPALDTSVEVFDLTADPSVLQIEAGVMRITFSRFGAEVGEVLSITNTSDRLFLTEEHVTETQRVALRIPLPPGATGIAFEPGLQDSRLHYDEEQGVILDTQPVRPGGEQVFFSYLIPYTDGAIIEQELSYPLSGQFHLLIEAGQVGFESAMFHGGDPVDMGGMNFETYLSDVTLQPGEAISFTLTGTPASVAAEVQPAGGGGLSPVVLLLVVAGLALIGVGGFLFLLRQDGGKSAQRAADALLDKIAELDDQHDQGMLNHDYYQRKRAELKAQLAELMRDQEGEEESAG